MFLKTSFTIYDEHGITTTIIATITSSLLGVLPAAFLSARDVEIWRRVRDFFYYWWRNFLFFGIPATQITTRLELKNFKKKTANKMAVRHLEFVPYTAGEQHVFLISSVFGSSTLNCLSSGEHRTFATLWLWFVASCHPDGHPSSASAAWAKKLAKRRSTDGDVSTSLGFVRRKAPSCEYSFKRCTEGRH